MLHCERLSVGREQVLVLIRAQRDVSREPGERELRGRRLLLRVSDRG
jgi:hypothetical protein